MAAAICVISVQPQLVVTERPIGALGLKPLGALHLAFASGSKVDYFFIYDDKFLKKAKSFDKINTKVVSPTELVMELDI